MIVLPAAQPCVASTKETDESKTTPDGTTCEVHVVPPLVVARIAAPPLYEPTAHPVVALTKETPLRLSTVGTVCGDQCEPSIVAITTPAVPAVV